MGSIPIIKLLHCPLFLLSSPELSIYLVNIKKNNSSRTPRIKPTAAGWEARMLPLSFAALQFYIFYVSGCGSANSKLNLAASYNCGLFFSGYCFGRGPPSTPVQLFRRRTDSNSISFLFETVFGQQRSRSLSNKTSEACNLQLHSLK